MIVFATRLTAKKAAAGLLLLCAVAVSVGYLMPDTEPELYQPGRSPIWV